MTAKIIFDVGPLQEISVFAISAPMRDYRFIWYLNKSIEPDFIKGEPYIHFNKRQKKEIPFSIFLCQEYSDMFFIGNRTENHALFKQYKGVDFFLIWDRELNKNEASTWKAILKSVPGLTLAKQIEGDALVDFQTIVAEMEYQKMDRKEKEQEL
ncbi:MAG: IPExxxVDY family protein [Bacteroidales bacterium]|nr:IPExxxVDY family protein [Bacteroidales bacterium]